MLDIISVHADSTLLTDATINALSGCVLLKNRERVARMKNKQNAANTLIGEIIARTAISARTGIPGMKLEIDPDKYGKPHMINAPGVHFNTSHSGDLVVCAINDEPVGVDIEVIRAPKPDVAKRFFRSDEYEYITSGADAPDVAFFRIWTMKESYVKWLGKGLRARLDSFSVFEIQRQGRPVFHSIDVRPDALCCICTDTKQVNRYCQYSLDDVLKQLPADVHLP